MSATSHWFVFISRQNAPHWSFVSRESSHHQMITYSKNIPVYFVVTCCISIKDNKKQNMHFFAAAQANIANWFPWHSLPPKAPPSRLVLHVTLCCWSPSASMMSLWEGNNFTESKFTDYRFDDHFGATHKIKYFYWIMQDLRPGLK